MHIKRAVCYYYLYTLDYVVLAGIIKCLKCLKPFIGQVIIYDHLKWLGKWRPQAARYVSAATTSCLSQSGRFRLVTWL